MASFGHRFARRAEGSAAWAVPQRTLVIERPGSLSLVGDVASLRWKRAFDVAIALLGLVLAAPIMLITALLVKVTSPGPIFYRQERIGLNRRRLERRGGVAGSSEDRRRRDRRVLVNAGLPFTIFKFRTMVVDAEQGMPPVWAKERDPRITPLGRFLRTTRIDELPQFINVLHGDMSMVGPRPERAYFISRIESTVPEFPLRLFAKPGVTGLAQVELGYTNTDDGLREKLRHDLDYITRLSPGTDINIILRTFLVVLTGRGAN